MKIETDEIEAPGFLTRQLERIPRRTMGLRTAAIVETLLFLLLLTALNVIFGDGGRFSEFAPHPYWIIILLIAAQYGTNEALTASVLASVFLLAWNFPEQAMDESTFDYVFKVSFRPLLWIVASVVIGEMTVRQIQRHFQLQHDFEAAQKREKSITRAYEQLRGVKEGLETRIAGHLQGTVALYQSLKSIEGLSPVQILMGVGEMVGNVINPEKFSVFSFGPNGFEVISSIGWTDEDGYSRRLTSDAVLSQEMLHSRRIVCSINQDDAEILSAEGILAGPLIDPQSGQVFGMLKIEYMDFIDLTVTNVETFKILCEWAGSAYAQARQFKETLADTMHNAETGVMSQKFERFARDILVYMKSEQGVETTAIEATLKPAGRPTSKERVAIGKQFFQLVRDQLPANAMVCDGRRINLQYIILIPGTSIQQVDPILDKLNKWRDNIKDERLQTVEIQFEAKAIE